MLKKILLVVVLLLVGALAVGIWKTLTPPADLFAKTGSFAGCPPRPSCVSSVASDAEHAIAPLTTTLPPGEAVAGLRAVLEDMPNLHTLSGQESYLHAVFLTPTMRYRDDLELLVRADGRIDVRSVSRFGYRDFGVNRERVESLRQRWREVSAAGASGSGDARQP